MYCTSCGTEVSEETGFCTECGAALDTADAPARADAADAPARAEAAAPSGPRPNAGMAVAVGAVCVAAVIGVGIFVVGGQGGEGQVVSSASSGVTQTDRQVQSSSSTASSAPAGGKKLGGGTAYSGASSGGSQASSTTEKDVQEPTNPAAGETLTVKAADGTTLSGIVRKDASGFVIPDSSAVEYSLEELRALDLSDAELCIAWNEPFARQGYHFKSPGLQAYFQACSWYTDTGNGSSLTGAAAVNNSRLRQLAEESASGRQWENLATS